MNWVPHVSLVFVVVLCACAPLPLKNQQELLGVDLDNDGVADDIERYIESLAFQDEQKLSLLYAAYSMQKGVLFGAGYTRDKLGLVKELENASLRCITENEDGSFTAEQRELLTRRVLNNHERIEMYRRYSKEAGKLSTNESQNRSCTLFTSAKVPLQLDLVAAPICHDLALCGESSEPSERYIWDLDMY